MVLRRRIKIINFFSCFKLGLKYINSGGKVGWGADLFVFNNMGSVGDLIISHKFQQACPECFDK